MKLIIRFRQYLLTGTRWLHSMQTHKPRQLELPLRMK